MNSKHDRIFNQIYKRPCWNVQQGIGSFLTLEFGQPVLEIEEVHNKKNKPKRQVRVYGEWHLWICYCDWKYFQGDKLIAHNESSRRKIKQVTDDLNGQALSRVSFDKHKTVFQFDLGGRLETFPSRKYGEENIEQWFLFLPNKKVITCYSNGIIKQK